MLLDRIFAREILDSRGLPTIEVAVASGDDQVSASVPAGTSVGKYEAPVKYDGDSVRYFGKGVRDIARKLNNTGDLDGISIFSQRLIDKRIKMLNGDCINLGSGATLALSYAIAKLAALKKGMHLFEYMGGMLVTDRMPLPMVNVINGGSHASGGLSVQEVMIVPQEKRFSENVRIASECFHSILNQAKKLSLSTNVGHEGGIAPGFKTIDDAIDFIMQACCNYNIRISLDCAANEYYENHTYYFDNCEYNSQKMAERLNALVDKYNLLSIEDPMHEDDIEGWKALRDTGVMQRCKIIGDDLTATNSKRLLEMEKDKLINGVIIKPNQIGTLTEAIDFTNIAKSLSYATISSHRSGDTADTTISDFAVAFATDFVKIGCVTRSERTEKYNRLMLIESVIRGDI